MSDKPTLPYDEAVSVLNELLARDVEIEQLRLQLVVAKATCDDLKAQIKDAQEARDRLSREVRNPPSLFDRPAAALGDEMIAGMKAFNDAAEEKARATTTPYDDDVADGVRAAESRREGEWDLDGPPISPEVMPKLTGPARPRRGRKAAAQA